MQGGFRRKSEKKDIGRLKMSCASFAAPRLVFFAFELLNAKKPELAA
jgi:hypothetical protein